MIEPSSGAALAAAEPAARPEESADQGPRRRRKLPRRPSWRLLVAGAASSAVVAGAMLASSMQSPFPVAGITIEGAGPSVKPAVAAAIPNVVGQPFRAVDAGALEEQLESIEGIETATVDWQWWNTLAIAVTEQEPVAVVATAAGFRVLDPAGAAIRQVGQRPPGLPLLEAVGNEQRLVGLRVVQQVPDALLPQTDTVTVAAGGGSVEMRLTSGAVADLGAPDRLAEKFAVLSQLLPVGAERYSVAVPERPALQGIPAPAQP